MLSKDERRKRRMTMERQPKSLYDTYVSGLKKQAKVIVEERKSTVLEDMEILGNLINEL